MCLCWGILQKMYHNENTFKLYQDIVLPLHRTHCVGASIATSNTLAFTKCMKHLFYILLQCFIKEKHVDVYLKVSYIYYKPFKLVIVLRRFLSINTWNIVSMYNKDMYYDWNYLKTTFEQHISNVLCKLCKHVNAVH